MKTPKSLLLLLLLLLQLTLSAQVQWYQNQDGNNQLPVGTVATTVQSLTPSSFAACYLWKTENDVYTWKISKTHLNGTEQKTFFVSGTTSLTEIRTGKFNSLYVLQRNFPLGQNAGYLLYKLDSNLNIRVQKTISFPKGFNIFNLNCFEVDKSDNVYLAGDGQYPDGPGYGFASFVLKTNKNLATQWSRMDSTQTSYSRLHIDRWGRVIVVEDFFTFFPNVKITRISSNGQHVQQVNIETDPGRYSLFSSLDDNDNLLIYGGKTVSDTLQAMYLYKISRINGTVLYRKTHFKAQGSQLNDLKIDRNGKLYALVTIYNAGQQFCRISRINSKHGFISWNHSMPYSQDSCNLVKLVVNESYRFYAIGQRMSGTYLSKGFAVRMKKSGQMDGEIPSPDSSAFQRLHWLADGIFDKNNQLIVIGGTSDFDTTIYMNTYLRAFAVRYGNNNNCNNRTVKGEVETAVFENKTTEAESEKVVLSTSLVIYPNPVQGRLTVSGLQDEYDKVTVFNMQGAIVLQQEIRGSLARMDVSALTDGVYVLVLRSSVTFKEKSLKFVIRK